MSKLRGAFCSSLFTRLGVLALLLLSLAAVSFRQSQAAQACGTCWYAIGCACWTCSSSQQTACTLGSSPENQCQSGGKCTEGGDVPPAEGGGGS